MPSKPVLITIVDDVRATIGGFFMLSSGRRIAKKPATLNYRLEDLPPAVVTCGDCWSNARPGRSKCIKFDGAAIFASITAKLRNCA